MNDIRKAINAINRMKDAEDRLGYEIMEVGFFDWDYNYHDTGRYLLSLCRDYPDQIDIIEKTVIAICGYGFESLKERMKEHKNEWEAL